MLAGTGIRKIIIASLVVLFVSASAASANKASANIIAPDSVKKGTEVTIKIKVLHSSNNYFHYVNWVKISVDGKEVKRWNFSRSARPESEIFEQEFKYVVTAPVEISAEANCNLHGSKGLAKKLISVAE